MNEDEIDQGFVGEKRRHRDTILVYVPMHIGKKPHRKLSDHPEYPWAEQYEREDDGEDLRYEGQRLLLNRRRRLQNTDDQAQ